MSRLTLLKRAPLGSSLVFFASLILIATTAVVWLNARAADPVSVTWSDGDVHNNQITQLRATASLADGYETNTIARWQYAISGNSDDCQTFGTPIDITTIEGKTTNKPYVTIPPFSIAAGSANLNQTLCLKVFYKQTGSNTLRDKKFPIVMENDLPVINTPTQAGLKLTVTATDANPISFWNVKKSTSLPLNCLSNANYAKVTSSDNPQYQNDQRTLILPLTAADHDKYFCLQAKDVLGNGFGHLATAFQVDAEAPTLEVTASDSNAVVTISVTGDPVDKTSWQYVLASSTDSDATCASKSNYRALTRLTSRSPVTSTTQAQLTFTSTPSSKYYCFRAADSVGNYGYAHHEVEDVNSPPTVRSLRQGVDNNGGDDNDGELIVYGTATDSHGVDNDSWQYAVVSTNSCSASDTWNNDDGTVFTYDTAHARAELKVSGFSADDDDYICFRVADQALSDNYGYSSAFDIDTTPPVITASQTGSRLTARSDDGGRYSGWQYIKDEGNIVCDENDFVSGSGYSPRSGSSVNLQSSDLNKYFCFRARDSYNRYGYFATEQITVLSAYAPRISIKQDRNKLTVSSTSSGVDSTTWEYSRQTDRPTCNDALGGYNAIDNRQIELDEDDVSVWFCVRVDNLNGNTGYARYRIKSFDIAPPVVSVQLNGSTLVASSEDRDRNPDSWQYVRSAVNGDIDCDADNTNLRFNTASNANRRVALTEADNDRTYCFRVADRSGNYGYAESGYLSGINAAPVVTVAQSLATKSLTVSTTASDVDGLTWAWATSSSDPDCTAIAYTEVSDADLTATTKMIAIRNIADTQNNHYYCFRVADTSVVHGENYGYAKHRYDLNAPVVTTSLNNQRLTVTATDPAGIDVTSWRYAKFAQQPNCQTASIDADLPDTQSQTVALQAADNNFWLCFKVADKHGNTAYHAYLIGGVGGAPKIVAQQTPTTLTATAAGAVANTWYYALTATQPNCGPGTPLRFTKQANQVDLTEVDEDVNWVCFRANSSSGRTGYLTVRIDRTAPTIKVTAANNRLTVSSDDADLDQSSWSYAKSSQSFTCSAQLAFKDFTVSGKRVVIDTTNDGDTTKYYCFRVADKAGNLAYKQVQATGDKVVATDADMDDETTTDTTTTTQPVVTQTAFLPANWGTLSTEQRVAHWSANQATFDTAWAALSTGQKIALNPFGCATGKIRADNGRCLNGGEGAVTFTGLTSTPVAPRPTTPVAEEEEMVEEETEEVKEDEEATDDVILPVSEPMPVTPTEKPVEADDTDNNRRQLLLGVAGSVVIAAIIIFVYATTRRKRDQDDDYDNELE